MAEPRHLSRAPAREALIDIQFEPSVERLAIEDFCKQLTTEFPKQSDLWEAFVGFSLDGKQLPPNATHTVIGKRLDSNEVPHVLQCRTTGFTFSRLSPYGEWQDLRNEAHRLWTIFHAVVRPQTVKRIAVRYINEIKLPLPMDDFGDYLVCPPNVPESLPQTVSGFLHRVISPDDSNNCVAAITQAVEGAPVSQNGQMFVNLILDIDVFRTVTLDCGNFGEIWGVLDVLRDQKNKVFFGYLTEKTVEMFV